MKHCLLFLLQTLLVCIVSAQYRVMGRVVAFADNQPIASASVFFSNTSKGTATNAEGYFALDNIPEGRFELVVSCIGYETSVQTVQPSQVKEALLIKLKVKVAELEGVVVGGFKKETWEEWGKFFLDNFIGQTSDALDCKIKNTEAIEFRNYKKQRILKAFSDEILIIENKSLGYTIKYRLELFQYDFATRVLLYQGYPLFEEMETGRKGLQKRWTERREKVYYGSNMHFMRGLYRNRLAQDGFEIRRMVKQPNNEKQRIKELNKTEMVKKMHGNAVSIERTKRWSDSAAYYNEIMNQPDEKDIISPVLLTGDSIAYAMDSVTAGVVFDNYLYITYTKAKEDEDYLRSFHLSRLPMAQTSVINLPNKKGIAIISNGQYYDSLDLLSSGYWAWSEKMATMLPFDYWPKKKQ